MNENPSFQFFINNKIAPLCAKYNNFIENNDKSIAEYIFEKDFLPTKATELSTGYDVRIFNIECTNAEIEYTDFVWKIPPFANLKIDVGLQVICPPRWWLEMRPRSSMFLKNDLIALDGVIDQDYTRPLCLLARYAPRIKFDSHTHYIDIVKGYYGEVEYNVDSSIIEISNPQLTLTFGQRIAQLIPAPRYSMDITQIKNKSQFKKLVNLTDKDHGEGFGGTGK